MPCSQSLLALLLTLTIVALTLGAIVSSAFGWPLLLELASHFQAQYWIGVTILCLPLLLLRQRQALGVGLFCWVLLSAHLLTWYLPAPQVQAAGPGHFRLLSANLNVRNRNYDTVLALLRKEKPDVAILMEVGQDWISQLQQAKDILPYQFGQGSEYHLGITLLSQVPLQNPAIVSFAPDSTPSIVSRLTIRNQPLTLIATHPVPPIRPALFHSRNRQFAAIATYLEKLPQPETAIVLAGDLNISPWSPYYRRLVSKTGLVNTRQGSGLLPSWPVANTFSRLPNFLLPWLAIPIDHCLISPPLKVAQMRTGPNVGSDHLPLIVDLTLGS